MSWVGNNQSLIGSLPKVVEVALERSDKFLVAVRLNPQSWQWDATIRDLSGPVTTPEGSRLSARTPTRAAAQAIGCHLEMTDRGELAH